MINHSIKKILLLLLLLQPGLLAQTKSTPIDLDRQIERTAIEKVKSVLLINLSNLSIILEDPAKNTLGEIQVAVARAESILEKDKSIYRDAMIGVIKESSNRIANIVDLANANAFRGSRTRIKAIDPNYIRQNAYKFLDRAMNSLLLEERNRLEVEVSKLKSSKDEKDRKKSEELAKLSNFFLHVTFGEMDLMRWTPKTGQENWIYKVRKKGLLAG